MKREINAFGTAAAQLFFDSFAQNKTHRRIAVRIQNFGILIITHPERTKQSKFSPKTAQFQPNESPEKVRYPPKKGTLFAQERYSLCPRKAGLPHKTGMKSAPEAPKVQVYRALPAVYNKAVFQA
jgi:hypothetical protein